MTEIESVLITSEPDDEGKYHLLLQLNDDDVIPLSIEDAWGWVAEMQLAMMTAQYDAAVFAQIQALGMERVASGQVVISLRKDRPEFITMRKLDFELVPGVNPGGKAFVAIRRRGEHVGQWEPDDVDDHTLAVIGAITNVTLDEQYLRFLERFLKLERGRALNVISDLGVHRDRK